MAACFKHAVEKGLSISIAPHLDDGLGLGGWRNGLVFDPLARYGSFSYAEFMLYPLADALNAAIGPNTKVSFALQGEMSATVFYYPKSYLTLVPYIKNRVLAGVCVWRVLEREKEEERERERRKKAGGAKNNGGESSQKPEQKITPEKKNPKKTLRQARLVGEQHRGRPLDQPQQALRLRAPGHGRPVALRRRVPRSLREGPRQL